METASDAETDLNFCVPCLRDRSYEPASVYCSECNEVLCNDCKKHHYKNKLTSRHTVVDIKSDIGEIIRLDFVKNLTKCKNHLREDVRYLCKDHDQLCCNECAIISHRKCKSLVSLADSATSDFQKRGIDNLERMEDHVGKIKKHEENYRKRLSNAEIMMTDQLLCIKMQFDTAFRDFCRNMLKKARSDHISFQNSISTQLTNIDKFEADINESKEKIRSVEKYGLDLHMFLLEREMAIEMKQREQTLKVLHQATDRSEVSLSGAGTITSKLITCLQQNVSLNKYINNDALPQFPTFTHNKKQ